MGPILPLFLDILSHAYFWREREREEEEEQQQQLNFGFFTIDTGNSIKSKTKCVLFCMQLVITDQVWSVHTHD